LPAPRRIVSLVPSHTETLAAYGLTDALVGRTRYCTQPPELISRVAAVGGTKDPDIQAIVDLEPDFGGHQPRGKPSGGFSTLLQAAGLPIHVTHPCSLVQAIGMLAELGSVCGAAEAGQRLADRCRQAVEDLPSTLTPVSVFCPVWRNPWMTFSGNTYVNDVLALCGFANVFADGAAATAAGRADFFEVGLAELLRRRPETVILPDEPYMFSAKHAEELRGAGLDSSRFFLIDGKDLSWYGPRIPEALGRLSELLRTK